MRNTGIPNKNYIKTFCGKSISVYRRIFVEIGVVKVVRARFKIQTKREPGSGSNIYMISIPTIWNFRSRFAPVVHSRFAPMSLKGDCCVNKN